MACRVVKERMLRGRILPRCSLTIMNAFHADGKVTCHKEAVNI
jgi:hypothetical protein